MQPAILTKDTALFGSLAQYPSNFGTTLFNAAFAAKKINAIYKAFAVKPGRLESAVAGIRALGIRGAGVSMPFKGEVGDYLDWLAPEAREIGAVNTIVNTGRCLKGYNTDYFGARELLSTLPNIGRAKVVLLGSGGVASAIAAALCSLNNRTVTVVTRSKSEGQKFCQKWQFLEWRSWRQRDYIAGDLLINATPVGMISQEVDEMPVSEATITQFMTIMDVVITPLETRLLREAGRLGKQVLPGYEMSLQQAAKQFELYTGQMAPLDVMRGAIKQIGNS